MDHVARGGLSRRAEFGSSEAELQAASDDSADGQPLADLVRHMGELACRCPHIDIWGGCCGTWDTHLDQIARNVVEARASSAETEAAAGQSSTDLRV